MPRVGLPKNHCVCGNQNDLRQPVIELGDKQSVEKPRDTRGHQNREAWHRKSVKVVGSKNVQELGSHSTDAQHRGRES